MITVGLGKSPVSFTRCGRTAGEWYSLFFDSLPTSAHRYFPSQLNEFLDKIDTLIVALPLTAETENLLGYQELQRLGKNGVLVNIAR